MPIKRKCTFVIGVICIHLIMDDFIILTGRKSIRTSRLHQLLGASELLAPDIIKTSTKGKMYIHCKWEIYKINWNRFHLNGNDKITYLARKERLSLVSPRSLATFSCSNFCTYMATSGLCVILKTNEKLEMSKTWLQWVKNLHRSMFHIRNQHSGVETGFKIQFKTRALALRCCYWYSINIAKQIYTYGDDVRELRLINQTLFGI